VEVEDVSIGIERIDNRKGIGAFAQENTARHLPGQLTLTIAADQLAAYNAVSQVDIPERIDGSGRVAADPCRRFPIHQLATTLLLQQTVEENDRALFESHQSCLQFGKRQVIPEGDLELGRKRRQGGRKAVPIGLIGGHRSSSQDDELPGPGVKSQDKRHRLGDGNVLGNPGDLPVIRDHGRGEAVDPAEDDGNLSQELLPQGEHKLESGVVSGNHEIRG